MQSLCASAISWLISRLKYLVGYWTFKKVSNRLVRAFGLHDVQEFTSTIPGHESNAKEALIAWGFAQLSKAEGLQFLRRHYAG